ncbi:VOC family protein [Sphingomonas solaris]|uniref:VOC family protein n=1 Tax=Alterirhizorhabdus solaris TaxID=2529389 RepID=A0A558RCS1_9SPHN|nr:VOC family protein [Sphingomonas solaris]TVV77144.1 hypothetical protein FOY91_02115 [Sphingomonas solaris]
MFARPNSKYSQVAYVTNDVMAAARLFEETYGAPGFYHFTNMQPGGTIGNGPQLKIALARVGGVEIELIEPIGDGAAMFSDVLPGGSDLAIRFHHVAIRIDGPLENWEAYVASIDFDRHIVVFEGQMGDDLRFFYTDERATLGHHVEHVWMSPALSAQVTAATPTYPGAGAS